MSLSKRQGESKMIYHYFISWSGYYCNLADFLSVDINEKPLRIGRTELYKSLEYKYYFYYREFFKPALACVFFFTGVSDSMFPSGLQEYFQYSSLSKKCSGLYGLESSTDFKSLQNFSQSLADRSKGTTTTTGITADSMFRMYHCSSQIAGCNVVHQIGRCTITHQMCGCNLSVGKGDEYTKFCLSSLTQKFIHYYSF